MFLLCGASPIAGRISSQITLFLTRRADGPCLMMQYAGCMRGGATNHESYQFGRTRFCRLHVVGCAGSVPPKRRAVEGSGSAQVGIGVVQPRAVAGASAAHRRHSEPCPADRKEPHLWSRPARAPRATVPGGRSSSRAVARSTGTTVFVFQGLRAKCITLATASAHIRALVSAVPTGPPSRNLPDPPPGIFSSSATAVSAPCMCPYGAMSVGRQDLLGNIPQLHSTDTLGSDYGSPLRPALARRSRRSAAAEQLPNRGARHLSRLHLPMASIWPRNSS